VGIKYGQSVGFELVEEDAKRAAARIRRLAGSGLPLAPEVRRRLEAGLGADLGGVRVHAHAEADRVARSLHADAVACGPEIFFRSGAYAPQTLEGTWLLAHEAAHCLQAARGAGPGPLRVNVPGDADERAADAAAARVVQSGVCSCRTAPARSVVGPLEDDQPLLVRRHASWEHRLLGDAPPADLNAIAKQLPARHQILTDLLAFLNMWYKNPESVTEQMILARYPYLLPLRLQNGLLVTYGELNTLPDYMANPGVMDAQPKSIMLPILQAVRQEGYQRINGLLGGFVPWAFQDAVSINTGWSFLDLLTETKAIDNLTWNIGPNHTNHYTALVGRNACHFAPFTWYRWNEFYQIAVNSALSAYNATDQRLKDQYTHQAWMNHGYADHFLQDSFAAGHLVNKTLIMQWFLEWVTDKWYVPVADWDMVKYMTATRQGGLAARGLYNPANPGTVRDPQTAEEQPSLQARMAMCGVQADGSTQEISYQRYLAFLNSTVVQSASGALHDYFNATSLWVSSNAIQTPFQIWGDDTMLNGGDGVRIAGETAHMSQQSIVDILTTGQTAITAQAIWDRFPNRVRGGNNQMLPLEQWNDSVRGLAFSLFPDLHYYLLRAFPRIEYISVDQ
jgi:Domain of unknown function (DUF4157)